MKSRLTPKYIQQRNLYQTQFPQAYQFLMTLETDQENDLWLGTATNAHLYKGNAFLAYICLPSPTTITFSPRYNNKIYDFTKSCSERLFPDVIRGILEKQLPDGKGWWRSLSNERFELNSVTPDIVYNELLESIRALSSLGSSV